MQAVIPFLTFQTEAKEVMAFYTTVFPTAKIVSQIAYPDKPELLMNGHLKINESDFYFLDIGPDNAAPIEWGVSLYIEMDSEEEFYQIFKLLSEDGVVMMGPEAVGDLKLVTWVTDKFGVTWQFVSR